MLDAAGFSAAVSHLNEWNQLPGNDWGGMLSADAGARQRWYDRVCGLEGAAFTAAALIGLQDAPVDAADLFTAEPGGMGLFGPHGTTTASFAAVRAFARVAGLTGRLRDLSALPDGVAALAAAGENEAAVLLARHDGQAGSVIVRLSPAPWAGAARYEVQRVTAGGKLERVAGGDGWRAPVDLGAPGVRVVTFRRGV